MMTNHLNIYINDINPRPFNVTARQRSYLTRNNTTSMSRCSSTVFAVKGLVGFVDEGNTFFTPQTFMISGA